MKHLIIIVFLLVFTMALFAMPKIQVNVGLDLLGKLDTDIHDQTDVPDVTTGVTPSIEVLFPVSNSLLLGPGIGYQFGRNVDRTGISDQDKFGFVPLYLTGKLGLVKDMAFTPELVANIGYDLYTGTKNYKNIDTSVDEQYTLGGGICWGAGFGINFSGPDLQIMYQSFKGKRTIEESSLHNLYGDEQNNYSTLSVMLGWRF